MRRPGAADILRLTMTKTAIIEVDIGHGGRWKVQVDGHCQQETCRSLQDAHRVARDAAARRGECELVVRDAYHRVVRREYLQTPQRSA